ncbi:DUF6778 family protein [Marivita sp.]|uniref:DUF6778 family protein n=1 Tax=Marivita sp. TaxID=2003365 RepID=UPI003F72EBC3
MTSLFKMLAGLILAVTLTACGATPSATRSAMPDDTLPGFVLPDVRVASYSVTVPESLKVSERNLYYPHGDIVWRGDPRGDRHQQVKAIFEAGLRNAAPIVDGARAVRLDVQVVRFHALSEKARYSVGGVHDIDFKYRLMDVQTGMQIGQTKDVSADLEALAGQTAMAADARGETQKARIIAHLTRVFVEELTVPGGHVNANLGLLQQINDL